MLPPGGALKPEKISFPPGHGGVVAVAVALDGTVTERESYLTTGFLLRTQ